MPTRASRVGRHAAASSRIAFGSPSAGPESLATRLAHTRGSIAMLQNAAACRVLNDASWPSDQPCCRPPWLGGGCLQHRRESPPRGRPGAEGCWMDRKLERGVHRYAQAC